MGRGSGSLHITDSAALLYGSGRSGTRQARLTAEERATQTLAQEIAKHQAAGGRTRVEADGTRIWMSPKGKGMMYHRVGGPACESLDGSEQWIFEGKWHRTDGPAVTNSAGTRSWFHHGQRHRIDGPAIERADGAQEWWRDGQRHRDDGPAVEQADGSQEWFDHGQRHRENGPAIILANGDQEWWAQGQRYSKSR